MKKRNWRKHKSFNPRILLCKLLTFTAISTVALLSGAKAVFACGVVTGGRADWSYSPACGDRIIPRVYIPECRPKPIYQCFSEDNTQPGFQSEDSEEETT